MKTIPIALANHIAQGTTTLGHLLKITREDSQVFAFTSAQSDVTIGGTLYKASPGLNVSSLAITSGLAVDNLELTTLDDGSTFTFPDVLGGRWKNAAFVLSRYNWASPSDGVEPIMVGTIGNVDIRSNTVIAELRGLQQYLQQPIGALSSKTCRARLGDTLCGVNLATYTHAGTITSVTSNQVFTDSARTETDDYFGEGIITFTSGLNTGLSQKIKLYAADQFTLSRPMVFTVSVGDAYTATAGCRKRHDRTSSNPAGVSDCIDKFNNILNFQGEPHLPGVDEMTRPAA